MSNYIPVSVLSSKIYEKCILDRLVMHFEGNHLLDDRQFGFRAGGLTVSAIHQVVDAVYMPLMGRGRFQGCSAFNSSKTKF